MNLRWTILYCLTELRPLFLQIVYMYFYSDILKLVLILDITLYDIINFNTNDGINFTTYNII